MTAGKTARNARSWSGDLSDISPVGEGDRVIEGDPVRKMRWPLWLALLVAVVASWWVNVAYDRHIRQGAFARGQANGACRMWSEALTSDPVLKASAAATADGRDLNKTCARVLNGAVG